MLLRMVNTTLHTLEVRGRLFQYLILTFVLVGGGSLLLALVLRQWLLLTGVVVLIPATGIYLILDGRQVLKWRRAILLLGVSHTADYSKFRETIVKFNHLPTQSLRTMLATLPEALALESEKNTENFETISRRDERKIAVATLLLTSAPLALAGAAAYRSVFLVACALLLVLATAVSKTKRRD